MAFESIQFVIKNILPSISAEEWEFMSTSFQIETYKKNSFFNQAGELQTKIGFIEEGLFRGYYLNEKGVEINMRFALENMFITDYAALIQNLPSRYNYQCLENAKVICLPLEKLIEGYQKHKGIERFGRLIAEQILIAQQNRIESFQFYNAEERYLRFLKEFPSLQNRISVAHISSFLGIQRPSLSRIRKQIVQR